MAAAAALVAWLAVQESEDCRKMPPRETAAARSALRQVRHAMLGMNVLLSRLALDVIHDNAGDALCLRVQVKDCCGHERVDVLNAVDTLAGDFPYEVAFDEDAGITRRSPAAL